MRIVFMGTPEFAVESLDSLISNNYEVVGVVTVPDKPAGRGQKLQQSAVKEYALKNDLKVLQPEKLKDPDFVRELKELNADLHIVVAFRMLPEVVWNMPPNGTYNLHASLLPKYRGAAPINWAIIQGDTETGATTFKLKHEIDTGNILFNAKVNIKPTMTAGELHDVLKKEGAQLIVKTVKEIECKLRTNSPLEFLQQDDRLATHAPKLMKETCKIDWTKSAAGIYNLIRGLSPYPAAFTNLSMKGNEPLSMKIFQSRYELVKHNMSNGSLHTDNKTYLKIYCNDGILDITDVQLQGKKRMTIAEFLRGFRIAEDAHFI